MTLNTSSTRLDKIAWLHKQEAITKFSKFQLQKFLFLYEIFQYVDEKDYDFSSLKAYRNGPVFSDFHGDAVYRETELVDYLNKVRHEITIDETNAKVSKFLVETLTDTELSKLTYELDMWKIHQNNKTATIKASPMHEKDITSEDKELLQMVKTFEVPYDYKILKLGEKRFLFSQEDFERLNDNHLILLDSLSSEDNLSSPVYVEVTPDGRLVVD